MTRLIKSLLILFFALVGVTSFSVVHAQDPDPEEPAGVTSPTADSTDQMLPVFGPATPNREHGPGQLGPRRSNDKSQEPRVSFSQSPTGKLFRSVALPGWGQWSNGKKQKAAVYFGIESYFLTKALIWRHRAADRLTVWENSCGESGCDAKAFNNYDTARDRRNYFYWLTGVTVFISMFDAYADAYLLSLERTRDKGDDYWGGRASLIPEDEIRLLATLKL
jgi:hypothetical protein